MKKLVSLVLALVMLVSAVPALAEVSLPIVSEPLTLTIAVLRHTSDSSENFNEKAFAIQAEKETGIHIEWIEISGEDEKVATLLAGEHPDVYMGVLSDAMITENPDLFLPLNDKLEEYCPNVLATYEQLDGVEQFLTYPDGNIYGMAAFVWEDINEAVKSLPWINQAWMDQIGKPMPTTLDELYEVLVLFRDNDMNGNGDPSDEIPFNFCNVNEFSGIMKLAYPWGITGLYNIEDSKVVPTANTPAFREFLEYFHKLGKEGLFNVEGFSTTNEQFVAQMDSMRAGVFMGWQASNVITGMEKQNQYVAFDPISAEGYTAQLAATSTIVAYRNGFVISADSPNWEAALKWWDYLSQSQEMAYLVHRGPDGVAYETDEEGTRWSRTPTDEEMIAAGYEKYLGKAGTSAFSASLGSYIICPLLVNPILKHGHIRRAALAEWSEYLPKQTMSKGIIPADKNEEFMFMTEGLETAIYAFVASSIMDGVTDESWNNYVEQIDDSRSFTYSFGPDENEVFFSHNMRYSTAQFAALCTELGLKPQTLCVSERGRPVPCVSFGSGSKTLLFTSRHHACESTGTYLMEGVMRTLIGHVPEGYKVMCIPFVDMDGVVDGDQGKCRAPYDHNAAYIDEPIYESTRAIQNLAKEEDMAICIDLHSPWHFGERHDVVHIVRNFLMPEQQARFGKLLTARNQLHPGALRYDTANDLPFGVEWNTKTTCRNFVKWFAKNTSALLTLTIETAYFGTADNVVSQPKLIELGVCVAEAVCDYLAEEGC